MHAYFCKTRFAGIAIWEATYADENPTGDGSGNYYQYIKRTLKALAADKKMSCYGK